MHSFFAQLPSPPIDDIGHWLWVAVAASLVVAGLLHGVNEGRKLFARNPPLDDHLAELARKIAMLSPRADLDELRGEIEAEMDETNGEIKALGEKVHSAHSELQKQIASGFEALDQKRSRSIGNLHEHLTSTKERVAGMEASLNAATQTIHLLDAKIEGLRNHNHATRSR